MRVLGGNPPKTLTPTQRPIGHRAATGSTGADLRTRFERSRTAGRSDPCPSLRTPHQEGQRLPGAKSAMHVPVALRRSALLRPSPGFEPAPGNSCPSCHAVRTWSQGSDPCFPPAPAEAICRSAPVPPEHTRWPIRRCAGSNRLGGYRSGPHSVTGTPGSGSPGTCATCRSSRTAAATSAGASHIGTCPASGTSSSRPSGSASRSISA